ncbi:2Fe-2S iron-sulfur cluster-binding protein [Gloeocapsa sp. PCC 73106]|uniref:2Fe-2S iron-sulfur cluster-binding protein n=1 Tax=Gloeocapsa sp. PCC 73106 TaxID=102232 RepID=UPI0002ABE2BF|nr:2Fe-2S iron-sulfur cluster-binding protein [Gloeocapsa sp. PCC 73106]ELR98464.1 flavodoxin reductase family protein [Gloeocapsa sp. PCC 73106]
MFQSLKKINNPLLRIITAGLAASALVTMLSAVIIGWKAPKSQSSHKIGVYATLIAGATGGLFGLTTKAKKTQIKATEESSEWRDWRNFVVTRKVKESEEITSFYLQPQDANSLPDYQPGQFLTIKLDIPGQTRPVIRTYSLSDYTQTPTYYRLSIKREGTPQGLDFPPGIASNFMHDRVTEGTVIPCKPPNGKFFLDISRTTPAVFISNGVGITPMIAMAKAGVLFNPSRRLWFVHGARNGQYHALRQEISQLGANYPQLNLHYRYSRPDAEDNGQFHSQGYVDTPLIQELVSTNLLEAEYFLCGSPAFMDSLRQGLKEAGVSETKIFFESFSKSKSTAPVTPAVTGKSAQIFFSQSQQTLTWTPADGSILEFAEANNINSPFSCRAGICLTCMCKVEEGEVEYEEPPIGTPDTGTALICVGKPKTDRLVLEL